MKDKEYRRKFRNFCFQNSYSSPPPPSQKKRMILISNRLSTASIKCFNLLSPVFGWFQNGCNKVVIEPHVVQFWFEFILVISNRTSGSITLINRMCCGVIAVKFQSPPVSLVDTLKNARHNSIWLINFLNQSHMSSSQVQYRLIHILVRWFIVWETQILKHFYLVPSLIQTCVVFWYVTDCNISILQ